MNLPRANFRAILRTLNQQQVEFLIVGGVAAVMHGAPISTFDLDVVHRRDAGNIERLLKALDVLDARYRTHPTRVLKPQRSQLMSSGHQLPSTRYGPLDLLGEIGAGQGFDELVGESALVTIGRGLRVRVLQLEALIRVKAETAREKDRAVLAVLRRTLEEKRKGRRAQRERPMRRK